MASDSASVDPGSGVQETQFTAPADEAEELSYDGEQLESPPIKTFAKDGPSYDTFNGTVSGAIENPVNDDGAAQKAQKAVVSSRSLAPDLLRGLLMILMAIDHCAVSQGAWRHGVALESEGDGTIVDTWNDPVAWAARMSSHLCASGFMFLLGMGIVYFGRSRSKLGWSAREMAQHFAIRALVLAAVNELFFTVMLGGKFLILNPILLALAIDYLFAGLIWLAINASERTLSTMLDTSSDSPDDDAGRLLLPGETGSQCKRSVSAWALRCSWHIHNAFLLILTVITVAWNHWLSPHQGHCPGNVPASHSGPTQPSGTSLGPWFDFWFLPVTTKLVASPFPPLGWLSPVILGLLYGRIILSRDWKNYTINAGNAFMGVLFMVLFVLTRLLHFGNLSEDCLRMPEQLASPNKNQYLVSFRSFFYIIKYPPSFAYVALTMSINFLLLGLFGSLPEKYARRIPALLTFGRSALFFYIVHLALYFSLGPLLKRWFGHDLGYINPWEGKPAIGTHGKPTVMWVSWVLGLLILWPLCRWYARFKSTKNVNSVWRFF